MPRGKYERKKKIVKGPRKEPKRITSIHVEPFFNSEEVELRNQIRQWYDDAPTPEERQQRKAAMLGVMYGGARSKLGAYVTPSPPADAINPAHYQQHPSGIECITITEHFNFNRGNAIKYIWRADEKGSTLENLRKAQWYLNREISRLEKEATK